MAEELKLSTKDISDKSITQLKQDSSNGKKVLERDERLRQIKDRQNEERQRKLEELKAQAMATQKYREQKEEERRRRMDDLRLKENDRRQQVEDRKKAISDAERERREYILKKNQERDSRLETKRRHERSSTTFAFGSSTPRLLDPVDIGTISPSSYWGHRRSTSISNVAYNGTTTLSRRSSERELNNDTPKKRATSADDSTDSSPLSYRSVARRKTDLMPTIPSPREPTFGSRSSLYCHTPRTPGRAVSMSRLDQLAQPIRRNGEHIRAIIERQRQQQIDSMLSSNNNNNNNNNAFACNALLHHNQQHQQSGKKLRNMSRSLTHLSSGHNNKLTNNRKDASALRALRKDDDTTKSMTQLVSSVKPATVTVTTTRIVTKVTNRQQPLVKQNNDGNVSVATTGSRSGDVTPGGSASRPNSALSTANSVTGSGGTDVIRRRPKPIPRKPRPASIAGTGMTASIAGTGISSPALNDVIDKQKRDKPPINPRVYTVPRKQLSNSNLNNLSTSTITTTTTVTTIKSSETPKRPERRSTSAKKVTATKDSTPLQSPKIESKKIITDIHSNEKLDKPIDELGSNLQQPQPQEQQQQEQQNQVAQQPPQLQDTTKNNVANEAESNITITNNAHLIDNNNSIVNNNNNATITSSNSTIITETITNNDNQNNSNINDEIDINQKFIDDAKMHSIQTAAAAVVAEVTATIENEQEQLLQSIEPMSETESTATTIIDGGNSETNKDDSIIFDVKTDIIKDVTTSDNLSVERSENEMTASMMAKRINTEDEAKAALAERRRIAREEAERQAELERQRIEMERLAEEKRIAEEEERQRNLEEETLRLVEEQKMAEEQRLLQAIEEAKKREEEEKNRRLEEEKARIEREENERKAREEAERQKIEVAERLKQEEIEREVRRKRVEAIMSRTRKSTPGNTPSNTPNKNDDGNNNNNNNNNNDNNNNNNNGKEMSNETIEQQKINEKIQQTNQKNIAMNDYEKSVTDKENALMQSFDKSSLTNKINESSTTTDITPVIPLTQNMTTIIDGNNSQNLNNKSHNVTTTIITETTTTTNGNIKHDDIDLLLGNIPENNITEILNGNNGHRDTSLDNKIESTSDMITNNFGLIIDNQKLAENLTDQLIDINFETTNAVDTVSNLINNNNNNNSLQTNATLVTSDSHDNRDISLL